MHCEGDQLIFDQREVDLARPGLQLSMPVLEAPIALEAVQHRIHNLHEHQLKLSSSPLNAEKGLGRTLLGNMTYLLGTSRQLEDIIVATTDIGEETEAFLRELG